MKTCTKCHVEKPFDGFSLSRGKYVAACKTCVNEKSAQWYAANKERALAKSKEWFEANKERKQATIKAWGEANKAKRSQDAAKRYQENKDAILESNRKKYHANIEKERARNMAYFQQNKETHRARVAKYRKARIERTPAWTTEEDKLRMKCYYQVAKMRTRETGVTWSVDHIVPLQAETVSGLHVSWNLQVITKAENIAKGNRF
jgi:5-methylcytosine-specific restriction endonuclease McrA